MTTEKTILGINEIIELIPQRYPYLMIDRAEIADNDTEINAIKNVTINESQFMGHFPNNPIMPGVLQLEAMVQAADIAFIKYTGRKDGQLILKTVKKLRFKSPIIPGNQVNIHATISDVTDTSCTVTASCKVNGKVCSQASFSVAYVTTACLTPKSLTTEFKHELLEDGHAILHDINEITKIIPHRFPFQFIDTVSHMADGVIIGDKLVSANEPYAKGYAPQNPFMPNVVLLETAAQLACFQMLSKPENSNKIGLYLAVENTTINRPAIPGDRLTFVVEALGQKGFIGRFSAKIYCGEELIAEAGMAFALVDKE